MRENYNTMYTVGFFFFSYGATLLGIVNITGQVYCLKAVNKSNSLSISFGNSFLIQLYQPFISCHLLLLQSRWGEREESKSKMSCVTSHTKALGFSANRQEKKRKREKRSTSSTQANSTSIALLLPCKYFCFPFMNNLLKLILSVQFISYPDLVEVYIE